MTKKIINKKIAAIMTAIVIAASLTACGASNTGSGGTGTTVKNQETVSEADNNSDTKDGADTDSNDTNVSGTDGEVNLDTTAAGVLGTTDLFSERDLAQEADLEDAEKIALSDGEDVTITEEGVYVVSGSVKNVTIYVEAGDSDKVEIVLDGASITNEDEPCIYVKSGDKVFVTTASGSSNTLSVTDEYKADGDTNLDAVIFSRSDLTVKGLGTLNIESSDNGISSKDDLKVTGGTLNISCSGSALEANDSIRIYDGTIDISEANDGIHAENDDDDTLGYIYITGGTINIKAADDGIHGESIIQIDGGTFDISAAEGIEGTYVEINDGDITINASDDGINAAQKVDAYTPTFEFNGGSIKISMGQGDTDGVDANGYIYINGGTIDITGPSPFDYDKGAEHNGGTIIVNGTETDTIDNQFGGMEPGGNGNSFPEGMTPPDGMTPPEDGDFTPPEDGNFPENMTPPDGGKGGRPGKGGREVETTEQ